MSETVNFSSGTKNKLDVVESGYERPSPSLGHVALTESKEHLFSLTKLRPTIGIICGSGLGNLADKIDVSNGGAKIPYADIPHFPTSTAPGHNGVLVIGTLTDEKIPVVCMQGRFHLYEGYTAWTVTIPVRVFKLMGVEVLIVTNAAGGMNWDFQLGDLMVIKDHVNFPGFAGVSPLRGPNDPAFGERFLALNDVYDASFRQLARRIGDEMGIGSKLKDGIYAQIAGPTYETPAEMRLLKMLGIDAVGMSTVQEVITARHCGIKVLAFSVITDLGVFGYETKEQPNEQEVIKMAKSAEGLLYEFLLRFLKKIQKSDE